MSIRAAGRWRAVALAGVAAIFVSPLILLFLGSLRMPGLPPADGLELVPRAVRWANYESVFSLVPLARHTVNSLLVVLVAVPLTVLVASGAGFAIVRGSPRVRRVLLAITLLGLMIPVNALWVPRFVMFRWLGILDTLWPLIAPALMATTPFYVLIFALAYWRIPRSLFEAAQVEGLSPLQIWMRVAWPLGRPAAFAVAVLAFVFHWSNFMDALLFLSSADRYTVPLGLRALYTLEPALHPLLLAGAVVATLPPVIAFLFAQRAFFTRTLEGS